MSTKVAKVACLFVTMASVKNHGRIHAALQPVIDRFHELDSDISPLLSLARWIDLDSTTTTGRWVDGLLKKSKLLAVVEGD